MLDRVVTDDTNKSMPTGNNFTQMGDAVSHAPRLWCSPSRLRDPNRRPHAVAENALIPWHVIIFAIQATGGGI